MEEILAFIFDSIVSIVNFSLSFKVLGDFSLLHLILGFNLLLILFKLFTFGFVESGSSSDYIGGVMRSKNLENKIDKERYKSRTYVSDHGIISNDGSYHSTGTSVRTTRRLRE